MARIPSKTFAAVVVGACLVGVAVCAAAMLAASSGHESNTVGSYRVPGFGFSSITERGVGSDYTYRFVALDGGGLNWSDFELNVTVGSPNEDPRAAPVSIVNYTVLDSGGTELAFANGPSETSWSWTSVGDSHPQIIAGESLVVLSPVPLAGAGAYLNEYCRGVTSPDSVLIVPH